MGDWLHGLEMEEYREMFQSEGYRTWEDMRALSLLDHDKLKAMGVAKRGGCWNDRVWYVYADALSVVAMIGCG